MTPQLTEAIIRQYASAQSYERGLNYFHSGAVFNIQRRAGHFTAEVEGSDYDPYLVTIIFEGPDLRKALCTCPYDWGGYCKHIVAVLLVISRSSDKINERPTLDDLLSGLDDEQLHKVIVSLAEKTRDWWTKSRD